MMLKNLSLKKRIGILSVFLAIIVLSIGGTFAAYVSRSYVKGVSATPRQSLELSSDFLSVVPESAKEDDFPDRKIMLAEKDESDGAPYKFMFSISNTAEGAVSTKRMQYYLEMSGLPKGAEVKCDMIDDDIASKVQADGGFRAPAMKAYARETHSYTVIIPKEQMTSAVDIIVKATPDADSDTSGFILAGRLQPSISGIVAAFSYKGEFIDKGKVEDYAAFNYQISVSNASENHLMKLTWNNQLIEIDPLFAPDNNNSGTLTLTMNNTNNNHLIQFYRLPGKEISDWEDLQISFSKGD